MQSLKLTTQSCSILVIVTPCYKLTLVMCQDKISSPFILVLRYSSLHSTHYSYFYSHSLYLCSLPKRGIFVDPLFCPTSTCPIMCSFDTLQQFSCGLLLLVYPIFSKSPWGLQLRDLSNSIVTLGNPNLDLGPFRHPRFIQVHLAHQAPPQTHLGPLGSFRYTSPIRHHLKPTQAHLGTLSPLGTTLGLLRHPRPIQVHLAHQAPPQAYLAFQTHLDTLGPLGTTLGPFRYTWPIRHHLRPTQALQAHLDTLDPFWLALAHLGLPSLAQVTSQVGLHGLYDQHVLDFCFILFIYLFIFIFLFLFFYFFYYCMHLIIIFILFTFFLNC